MNHLPSLKQIVLAWLLLLAATIAGCNKKDLPNIILVVTDDQGYADLSCHGSPDVLTPNIDKLSTEGIRLTDFQVSPTCAPTRSAIMTGSHPFKNGITHTILERERMAPGLTTLPEVLKRAGYTTGIFGKWHLGDEPEYQPGQRGFDEVFVHGGGGIGQAYPGSCADVPGNNYFDPVIMHNGSFVQTRGFCTDIFFKQALGWIQSTGKSGKPFFAYIATNAPHGPYIAPDEYKRKYIEKGYSSHSQGFYGMIENIDDNMGILLGKLDQWNLSDETIVIFMSDNGKAFLGGERDPHGEVYNAGMRGFKNSVYEGGTRVPFIIKWPGQIAAGKNIDVMLNHYDILPTLADIAAVDISDLQGGLDGVSFLPVLKEQVTEPEDRYRFFHKGRWPKDSATAFIHLDSKDVGWFSSKEKSDPDQYKFRDCAVRNERFRLVNNCELYDLFADPGETTDVSELLPGIIEDMQEAYSAWWEAVRPFMVNESESLDKEKPFRVEYEKQKAGTGIPEWAQPEL